MTCCVQDRQETSGQHGGHWSPATGRWPLVAGLRAHRAESAAASGNRLWVSGHRLSRLYFQLRHAAPQTSRSRGSRGPQSRPESARASFGKCSGPRAKADGGVSWPGRARSPCSGEKTGTGRRRRGCSQAGQSRNPSPLAASCFCNPAVFVRDLCTYRQLPSYKRPV